MKIAIVRGPSLNLWEMQNYLPLTQKHELLAIGSLGGHYDWDSQLKTKKLLCLGQVFSFVPRGIEFLYRFFGDPQMLLRLEEAVSGFEIVHTAEAANYYSFQALKARRKGLFGKLVITCWENLPGLHENYPAQKRIKKAVIEGADHFLAVTEQAKRALVADGAREERITVIPMGVNLEKFNPSAEFTQSEVDGLRARVKSDPFGKTQGHPEQGRMDEKLKVRKKKSFEILFVGRLVEEKGIYDLFKAGCGLLKKKETGVKFVLVGEGSEKEKLKEMVVKEGVGDNFLLEGGVSYQKMPEIMASADLLVLPSKPKKDWQEQFGMVLVEAMTSGVPVIATYTGAIPEVMDEAGILVEPGNVPELSEAIIKVLKDEKLRADLALKGRRRAEAEYDCRKVALKIEELYHKIRGN